MALITSILFAISLILAVTLGPQSRSWSWGAALIPLGIAAITALPVAIRAKRFIDPWLVLTGAFAAGWFAWRASVSPVKDAAVSDLLLLAAAVGSFLATRVSLSNRKSITVFLWTIAGLVIANVVVVLIQMRDPSFSPILGSRPVQLPSGLQLHYNEGANFLIGASFLLGAFAFSGNHSKLARITFGIILLSGMAGIYFTRSRGGILALAVALMVLTVVVLVHGKRDGVRWFGAAAVALPMLMVGAVLFTLYAWLKAQEVRGMQANIDSLLDNNVRLYLLSIVFSCIGSHPWAGGGSRSYSWECYEFWNVLEYGWHNTRPEFVHNELLQAITDYGILGGLLLGLFVISAIVLAMVRGLLPPEKQRHPCSDALHAGGLASFAGMFVQSNFSFVFHLLPGAMLLGISLACICLPSGEQTEQPGVRTWSVKLILASACAAVAMIALPYGWKGLQVMVKVWPVYFSPSPMNDPMLRADLLADALHVWPQSALYKDRALGLHAVVFNQLSEGAPAPALDEVISDYRAGLEKNPKDITLSVNLGNLLNQMGRDEEALEEYRRSIQLQGGVEIGFGAHSRTSELLLKIGRRQLAEKQFGEAVLTFASAIEHFDEAVAANPAIASSSQGANLRNSIWDGLGVSQESTGDFDSALETYRHSAKEGSGYGHYRAGNLLGRMAGTSHTERKAALAHSLFLKARDEMAAANELPPGTTKQNQEKQLAYFDEMIRFFVDARVLPVEGDK